jgi:hypothetical protein
MMSSNARNKNKLFRKCLRLKDRMPEGFKEPIGIKGGGFIAKGCGKVMGDRRKVTKMY